LQAQSPKVGKTGGERTEKKGNPRASFEVKGGSKKHMGGKKKTDQRTRGEVGKKLQRAGQSQKTAMDKVGNGGVVDP